MYTRLLEVVLALQQGRFRFRQHVLERTGRGGVVTKFLQRVLQGPRFVRRKGVRVRHGSEVKLALLQVAACVRQTKHTRSSERRG